jgi:signal recognition particle subunit SRP19
MPTVEDYFDDDTELPLPSSSSSSRPRALQGDGHKGALLEEITEDDDFDYGQMADQGRGIFGENSIAPPVPAGGSVKGKDVMRGDEEIRPSGPGAGAGAGGNVNTPMGGFMGDMMKFQQAEEERMEKMRKQLGTTTIASDASIYKE